APRPGRVLRTSAEGNRRGAVGDRGGASRRRRDLRAGGIRRRHRYAAEGPRVGGRARLPAGAELRDRRAAARHRGVAAGARGPRALEGGGRRRTEEDGRQRGASGFRAPRGSRRRSARAGTACLPRDAGRGEGHTARSAHNARRPEIRRSQRAAPRSTRKRRRGRQKDRVDFATCEGQAAVTLMMLYLDCFSGASGDMILGALLDLGLPLDALKAALGSLAVEYGDIRADRVLRAGGTATKCRGGDAGAGDDGHKHYHLKGIVNAIRRSALSLEGQDRAVHLFERLAAAEAAIHGTPIEKVHLHEVGALDSIVDIVGAVFGFEWLGIDDIEASPVNVGGGMVTCAHGTFPVPAPATARLLEGVPVYGGGTSEMVTPTGALLVTSYAKAFGPLPAMRISKIGYGAGDRDPKDTPNVIRMLVGERTSNLESRTPDSVIKIECEIDDMNPQLFGPLMDGLLAAGALDVFYIPVQMKKGRPGTLVTVLAPPAARDALTEVLFRDSTTIGVRYLEMERSCLDRTIETVQTPYGPVRFKVARRDGTELNAAPEFDDCQVLAAEHGVSIKTIQAAAIQARARS